MTSETHSSTHTPVRIGLVGYGWWGKTIAKQIHSSNRMSLVAVVEVSAELRQQMATDPVLQGCLLYTSPSPRD